MKKTNKVTEKELLKRCAHALFYARDLIESVAGSDDAVEEFDEDVNKILRGKKTVKDADAQAIKDLLSL